MASTSAIRVASPWKPGGNTLKRRYFVVTKFIDLRISSHGEGCLPSRSTARNWREWNPVRAPEVAGRAEGVDRRCTPAVARLIGSQATVPRGARLFGHGEPLSESDIRDSQLTRHWRILGGGAAALSRGARGAGEGAGGGGLENGVAKEGTRVRLSTRLALRRKGHFWWPNSILSGPTLWPASEEIQGTIKLTRSTLDDERSSDSSLQFVSKLPRNFDRNIDGDLEAPHAHFHLYDRIAVRKIQSGAGAESKPRPVVAWQHHLSRIIYYRATTASSKSGQERNHRNHGQETSGTS
ncbi:hypothetical protein KM043_002159 [Ampulex compressa]|nr:hypothetical protein KM043_002159 [Ampulex compressa]